MSERKTLFARWRDLGPWSTKRQQDQLARLTSDDLEALRAEYEARIARLEVQVDSLMERVGVLEVK